MNKKEEVSPFANFSLHDEDVATETKEDVKESETKEDVKETETTETEDTVEEKKEETTEETKTEEKKEEVVEEKKEEEVKEEETKVEGKEDENKGEENKEGEGEEDIFGIDDKLKESEKTKSSSDFDWVAFGKEAGIEVSDNSKKSFIEAQNKALEDAREEVAIDVSEYSDDVRKVIEHIEGGGTLADILNVTKAYDDFLVLTPEEKIRYAAINEGMDEDEIDDYIEDLKDDDKFDKEVNTINKNVLKAREQKYNEFIEESQSSKEEFLNSEAKRAEAQRNELIEEIKKAEVFMGQEITPKVKEYLVSQVEDGTIFNKLNTAQAQLNAIMQLEFGDNIYKSFEKKIGEESRKGYNEAKRKEQSSRHNIAPKTTATSHQNSSSTSDAPFSTLKQMLED